MLKVPQFQIPYNLSHAIPITVLYYRTKVECAGFCLSREDCFAFRFDDRKFKCTLLQENGICTAYKDDETFIYAKDDGHKTIIKCRT